MKLNWKQDSETVWFAYESGAEVASVELTTYDRFEVVIFGTMDVEEFGTLEAAKTYVEREMAK